MRDTSLKSLHGELHRLRLRVAELETDQESPYRRLTEGIAAVPWEGPAGEFSFSYVGPQAESFLGFPRADWYVPDFHLSHMHPEDRDGVMHRHREETAQRRDHTLDYRMVAADGRIVQVMDAVRLVSEGPGQVRAYGLLLDVTDRKRAEEERRALAEKTCRTQNLESLGVLAGGLAHDFNNLLTAILGYTELAENELPPGAVGRLYLREATTAAHRAADLTQQILLYAGKARCVLVPTDLSLFVQEMSRALHTVAPRALLRLECTLQLPKIAADHDQLRRLLVNLVTNAAEALEDRPGSITVRTSVRHLLDDKTQRTDTKDITRERKEPSCCLESSSIVHASGGCSAGPHVWLEVTDTGCGMSAATLEKIFDPFFTTHFTGRGLGLAVVLGIVRSHRGLLRVSSVPGQGTTFAVLFPALCEQVPAPREQPAGDAGGVRR